MPLDLHLDRTRYCESKLLQSLQQATRNPIAVTDTPITSARLIRDYLAVVRSRERLHRTRQRQEAIKLEIRTLDSILMWTPTNDALFEGLKAILQHVEGGNIEAVKDTVRRMQEIRKDEISERQRQIAKKPRSNPFSKLLDSLVEENPDISEAEVLRKLKSLAGHGVVSRVTGDTIEIDVETPEYVADIGLHTLKDRLYRAKARRRKITALAG